MNTSIAIEALRMTASFESELLVELMLRFWDHPLADDDAYRNNLLESASEALRASIDGAKLYEDIKPQDVNLVAAICYVESVTIDTENLPKREKTARLKWLKTVQKALPSCFCDPDLLS